MTFIRYPHLERLGGSEVQDILIGDVVAFYKIDGTNGSIWYDEDKGRMRFGSRNRELSIGSDNAGFMSSLCDDEKLLEFFQGFPELALYGEWLVPHSLKTYRDNAWRKFYIFDVYSRETNTFLSYDRYSDILDAYELEYIPPIAIMKNPQPEQIFQLLEKTGQFLVKDGEGQGEGIVLKNYNFVNSHGRTTWAKVISNEFKEIHHKVMGAPIVLGTKLVEQEIVEEYVTAHFVLKERDKIAANCEWSNRNIPELLGRVFYELVREETPNFVKKHKNPTINFKTLQALTTLKVKEVLGL